jgi:hypothetical protein
MEDNNLALFCDKYELVFQKSYFSARFMRNKVYDGTLYLCFICMTNGSYQQSWEFDSSLDYKGIYDVSNSRYSKFHICSSLKAMCTHTLENHRAFVKYDRFMNVHNFWECFINLTDYKDEASWNKAHQQYIAKVDSKRHKKIESVKQTDINEDVRKSALPKQDEDMMHLKLTLSKLMSQSPNRTKSTVKETRNKKVKVESFLAKRIRLANASELKKQTSANMTHSVYPKKQKNEMYDDNDEVFWKENSNKHVSSVVLFVSECDEDYDIFKEDPF